MFPYNDIPEDEERRSCRPGEQDLQGAHRTDTHEHCLEKNVVMVGGGLMAPNIILQMKKMPKNEYHIMRDIPNSLNIESNEWKGTDMLDNEHKTEFIKGN